MLLTDFFIRFANLWTKCSTAAEGPLVAPATAQPNWKYNQPVIQVAAKRMHLHALLQVAVGCRQPTTIYLQCPGSTHLIPVFIFVEGWPDRVQLSELNFRCAAILWPRVQIHSWLPGGVANNPSALILRPPPSAGCIENRSQWPLTHVLLSPIAAKV